MYGPDLIGPESAGAAVLGRSLVASGSLLAAPARYEERGTQTHYRPLAARIENRHPIAVALICT
jgi:hypothetical protein